jgi:hypothetical protein
MPVGAGMGLLTGTIANMLMRHLPPLKRIEKQED